MFLEKERLLQYLLGKLFADVADLSVGEYFLIYTVLLVGDGGMRVRLNARKPGLTPSCIYR